MTDQIPSVIQTLHGRGVRKLSRRERPRYTKLCRLLKRKSLPYAGTENFKLASQGVARN